MLRQPSIPSPDRIVCVLRSAVLGLLTLFAAACSESAPTAPLQSPVRNLVIIGLDTVRFDAFSLPETRPPGDSLTLWLESALDFAHAQSTSSWTVPAVASLLTGLYPRQHGAGRFTDAVADLSDTVPSAIVAEVRTLPEILEADGFATAAFVAHPWFRTGYDLDRGFGALEFRGQSQVLTDRALEWLDDRSQDETAQRFFLYLHYMEAHERHRQAPEEVNATVAAMAPETRTAARALAPSDGCADAEADSCRRFLAYVDAVLELRQRIAQVLQGLEERGLLAETLVVVYSDHGEEFDDHVDEGRADGLDPRGIYGAGHGHTLYQELLHVPLLVWQPGLPGRSVDRPASLIDIVPSVLAWLAIGDSRSPSAWPGTEIDRLLENETHANRPLFSSGIAYGPQRLAVLDGSWKRVHTPSQGTARLYDLLEDPNERTPIDDRKLALSLDRQLSRHLASREADGSSAPEIPPEFLEELQSLGYLEGSQGSPR